MVVHFMLLSYDNSIYGKHKLIMTNNHSQRIVFSVATIGSQVSCPSVLRSGSYIVNEPQRDIADDTSSFFDEPSQILLDNMERELETAEDALETLDGADDANNDGSAVDGVDDRDAEAEKEARAE